MNSKWVCMHIFFVFIVVVKLQVHFISIAPYMCSIFPFIQCFVLFLMVLVVLYLVLSFFAHKFPLENTWCAWMGAKAQMEMEMKMHDNWKIRMYIWRDMVKRKGNFSITFTFFLCGSSYIFHLYFFFFLLLFLVYLCYLLVCRLVDVCVFFFSARRLTDEFNLYLEKKKLIIFFLLCFQLTYLIKQSTHAMSNATHQSNVTFFRSVTEIKKRCLKTAINCFFFCYKQLFICVTFTFFLYCSTEINWKLFQLAIAQKGDYCFQRTNNLTFSFSEYLWLCACFSNKTWKLFQCSNLE